MIKGGNYGGAYYTLFKNGSLEKKLEALDLYEQWLEANGDKTVPMDQEIDLITTTEDYIEESE